VELRGRVCVVTGASSGIGGATVRTLAARGNTVVATARRADRLRALLDEVAPLAPKSFWLAGDLAERDFAEHLIAETLARLGRIDVLVNNAGTPMHKLAYHVTPEDVEWTLRVNFLACAWTTSAALPAMLRQEDGAIVNVSSLAALVVPPREGVYAASKAALDAWSEGLWYDLAGSGIHVALVNPGPIETEIWDKRQEASGYTGRLWPAQQVADAIVEAVEGRRHRILVPRHRLEYFFARSLRLVAPGLLRFAMQRFDPVPPEQVAEARARARGPVPSGGGSGADDGSE
jgi:short-subunit dehydrogenase